MFEPFPDPKYRQSGPQKVKNDPKVKSKSNVRIEGKIETDSCSITRVDPKTVVKPILNPKNSSLGPKKAKDDPKI